MARPTTMMTVNIAMCALLLVNVAVLVHGHAYSKIPASRQFLNPTEYTPSGANGRDPVPQAVCGDFGNQPTLPVFGKRGQFGIPQENHFVAGQKATFTINMLAPHKGRFEWRICQYSGAETTRTLNKACLDKHILQPAPGQSRVVPGMPYWWFGNLGGGDHTMDFMIPNDLNCDGVNTHCVMQMVYQNGNSCNPPGPSCPTEEPASCFPTGWNPVCTLSGWESFRNCIDIIVKPKGGGGQQQHTPVKRPTPSTRPKPAGGDACCKGKPNGLQAYPGNCRRVCRCSNGRTTQHLACRAGFKFDNKTKKCRKAQYLSCR